MRKKLKKIGIYFVLLIIGVSTTYYALVLKEDIEHEKSHEKIDRMKFGVIDKKGNWVCTPKIVNLDAIETQFDLHKNVYETTNNAELTKLGIKALPFHYHRAIALIGDRFGVVDTHGRVVVKPIFERYDDMDKGSISIIVSYSDGLAKIKLDGKYGFLDVFGNIVVEPKFDEAESFSDGLAGFYDGRKMGFLDKNGLVAIAPKFDMVGQFRNGRVLVGVCD